MLRDKAKKKLAGEIEGKDYLIPFEEYLTGICETDEIAEKILAKDKTLERCYKNIESYARQRKNGACACIADEEVFRIMREYYGIDADAKKEEEKADAVDIMDLL
jgi:hypothetical protein